MPLAARRAINTSRIHIDARSFAGGGTGVSTYARVLAEAVRESGRTCHALRAAGDPLRVTRLARSILPGARQLRSDAAGDLMGHDIFRLAHVRFGLTGKVLRLRAPGPPAVMHWSYPVPLMIEGWANLYTIHDLIPLTRPDLTPINPRRHARLLAAVVRVADRIVTVSEAARADILSAIDVAGDRVVNCGQAVSAEPAASDLPSGLSRDGYFLFYGRIEPRKNLLRLIDAHAASGTALPLILAGPAAEGGEPILAAARATANVRYLDYLDRPTLLALIASARAVLFPSLAEGFGLPVAEAMSLGTPVLISRDPALVETAGGAALSVDAEDVLGMARAIKTLDHDAGLRADLRDRGCVRKATFTVPAFAGRLDALYASLVDED